MNLLWKCHGARFDFILNFVDWKFFKNSKINTYRKIITVACEILMQKKIKWAQLIHKFSMFPVICKILGLEKQLVESVPYLSRILFSTCGVPKGRIFDPAINLQKTIDNNSIGIFDTTLIANSKKIIFGQLFKKKWISGWCGRQWMSLPKSEGKLHKIGFYLWNLISWAAKEVQDSKISMIFSKCHSWNF